MKNLAIIPARAGSKRIPGKNKRLFLGKPLIQWTMDAALGVQEISKVVVTTDDIDILNMANFYPKITFIHREGYLATDAATSVDVIVDVMSRVDGEFDNIILLQPTSPLRDSECIKNALNFCRHNAFKQVVSVRDSHENVMHLAIESNKKLTKLVSFLPNEDADRLVTLNGAIYISDYSYFRIRKTFFTEKTGAFLMAPELSVDIDYEEDWVNAELIGARLSKKEGT